MTKKLGIQNCWSIASILVLFMLASCGGGGGGGSSESMGEPAASDTSGTTVSGGVMKGPVRGATVSFYEIDDLGLPVSYVATTTKIIATTTTAVVTTTTDDSGSFTVTIPDGFGTLLVETSGGIFADESDQKGERQIQLGSEEGFSSILAEGSTVVAINPYTDALVQRGRLLAIIDGNFMELFDEGKALLDAETGFDVLSTIPANPVAPASDATTAEKQYALMLGGIANAVNNIALQMGLAEPTFELIHAVTYDMFDGSLDGHAFGEPIHLSSNNAFLPTNVDYDAEMNRFRNNNFASYDGISLPDIDGTALANPSILADTDGDEVPDYFDNCPDTANASQTDMDGDEIGDACDLAGPAVWNEFNWDAAKWQ